MPKAAVSKSGSKTSSAVKSVLKGDLLERFVPILLIVSVALAFLVGMLWQKVTYLEKGVTVAGTQAQQAGTAPTPQTASLDQIKDLFNKDLIKFGDANSKLLLVEVADPSCPYCHIAGGLNPELNKQVSPQYTLVSDGGTYVAPVTEMKKLVDAGQASFVWIYSPGHGNGEMGTKAMYCAYENGKFWDVHDVLMTNKGYDFLNNTIKNDKTKSGDLADFLARVYDKNTMKACLDSGKYDQRILDDTSLARTIGVSGTPGFYINEKFFPGAYSFKDMEVTVKAALGTL